jgi:tetratricopeptide (TPR) repeat protein
MSPLAGEGFSPLGVTGAAFDAEGRLFVAGGGRQVRVWEPALGRRIRSYTAGAEDPWFAAALPDALSPDASLRARIADDGGIAILDAKNGREKIRLYSFEGDEWLSLVPEGFYNASFHGASFFSVKAGDSAYTLGQFSETLRRPDLLAKSFVEGAGAAGAAFAGVLKKNGTPKEEPPLVSARLSPDLWTTGGGPVLEVTVIERKGGAGPLVLYRRGSKGRETPAGFFDIAHNKRRTYRENGEIRHELLVYAAMETGDSVIGVSAFNSGVTLESERVWTEFSPPPEKGAEAGQESKPLLYVVFAGPGQGDAQTEAFFSRQETGALYAKTEIIRLEGDAFGQGEFESLFDELKTRVGHQDVLILCFRGGAGIDGRGDLYFTPGGGRRGKDGVTKRGIAENLLKLKTANTALLIDTGLAPDDVRVEAALERLLERLGQRALFASASDTAPRLAAAAAENIDGEFVPHLGALDLFLRVNGRGFYASLPEKDFVFLDRLLDPGELRVSVLFPGTLTVTRHDGTRAAARYLDSLESAVLYLPEGNYRVSMTYRNSFEESHDAELRGKGVFPVSFSYRPRLDQGDFRGPLPAFGINLAELNPSGYRKIDQDVLRQMGMEQHRISFLAGEKWYQSGDYDRAIAEFNKALDLRADYAEAYAARGNAYQKKGNAAKAIEDYNTALRHRADLPEVYNYRGFAHAGGGDLAKAVADYSQALKLRKDYADAYFNRAHALAQNGDYAKAIEDYTHVLRLEPRNAAALNQRGSAWYQNEDDDRAIHDYSEAIKIRPDYALAWHNRGNAWFNKGDYDRALADLNQAIKLAPGSANAYVSRGNILQKLGDSGRAAADFAAAERIRAR